MKYSDGLLFLRDIPMGEDLYGVRLPVESAVYQDGFASTLPACRRYLSWKDSTGSPSPVDSTGSPPTFGLDNGEFRDLFSAVRGVHSEPMHVRSSSDSVLTGTQFGVPVPLPGCVFAPR